MRTLLKQPGCWYEQLFNVLPMSRVVFEELLTMHPPQHDVVIMPGGPVEIPRWQKLYGPDYHFAGTTHKGHPIDHTFLAAAVQWVCEHSGSPYNQILMNWYQDGDHYMGPHGDNIKPLVPNSCIYSFSYGAERDFVITANSGLEQRIVLTMPSNSLIIMNDEMQLWYKHTLPKRKRVKEWRINITVRYFLPSLSLQAIKKPSIKLPPKLIKGRKARDAAARKIQKRWRWWIVYRDLAWLRDSLRD